MYFASHLANTVSYETVKLYLVAVQDLDYHQQAGRAGRDGNTSDIVVIYHGQQLSHCEEDVKSFVRSDDCLREASYRPFDGNVRPLNPQFVHVVTML